tara:strand:+ start:367 stop:576 length:210 start_codon:yes stop_codon:yes gene_type:complete
MKNKENKNTRGSHHYNYAYAKLSGKLQAQIQMAMPKECAEAAIKTLDEIDKLNLQMVVSLVEHEFTLKD